MRAIVRCHRLLVRRIITSVQRCENRNCVLGKKPKLTPATPLGSSTAAAAVAMVMVGSSTDFCGEAGSSLRAAQKRAWDEEEAAPMEESGDEWMQRRGRGRSATNHRLGHTRNAGGPNQPKRAALPCIRLTYAENGKGCTYSEDCDTCIQEIDGDLNALRRQRKACQNEGEADRRLRFFFLGDWLSIAAPSGIGGPTSTFCCMYCLCKLHCTCVAGLPALPQMPPSVVDTRPVLHRHPPYRAGSASIRVQSSRLAADRAVHEANPTAKRKPEPANYDSCLHDPLYDFDHPITSMGCTTLHYSLGVGKRPFPSSRGEDEVV